MKSLSLSADEFERLKRKEALADDLLLQLSKSLADAKKGKIKK